MKKRLPMIVLAAVVIGAGFYFYKQSQRSELSNDPRFASGNGRLEATEVSIASKLAGRIEKIMVDEGDFITAGQQLALMQTNVLRAQLAQAEAQRILIEARGEAEIQARQLQQEIRDSWEKLAAAQSETESFIQRSRELCAQQMAFLDALPERNAPEQEEQSEAVALPAPQENAVPVAEAATDAGLASQEEPSQEQQPDPEPQPVEKPQEKKEEDSPFPLDFKLNLEDLQFGRNYNGGDRR